MGVEETLAQMSRTLARLQADMNAIKASIQYMNGASSEEYLTTSELMDMLKIKQASTIANYRERGLPFTMIGRNYRYPREGVVEWANKYLVK